MINLPNNSKMISLSVNIIQNADAMADSEEPDNVLSVDVVDPGNGPYAVIRTDRWAVDISECKDLSKLLHGLIEMAMERKSISLN